LAAVGRLRLLGLVRSSFGAGDFDILPSLKKRPTVRTSCFSPWRRMAATI